MARYVRNTAVLAKIESAYGTDPTPTGTANSILVSNLSINPLNAGNVDRALIRPYFGAGEQLLGTAYVECGFDVEIAGAGTAGVAPAYGPLLKACGFAETVTASTRVEYLPSTPGTDSVTIYWYDDGLLHKAIGARGTIQIKATIGIKPVFSFRFLAIDGGVTATANATTTLTAFRTPLVVTDTNTGDLTIGGTYNSTSVTVGGGTAYPSQGFEMDLGNAVNHTPLLGGESVDITDRSVSAKFNLDLTAAQEASFMTNVKAATLQTVGIVHGTAAGNKVLFWGTQVQLISPSKAEVNGRRLIGFDSRFTPSTGNDELRIVVA
ncbi:MAG: hypothetical protein RLZZ524_1596 [Pseudomonadota bacterium]